MADYHDVNPLSNSESPDEGLEAFGYALEKLGFSTTSIAAFYEGAVTGWTIAEEMPEVDVLTAFATYKNGAGIEIDADGDVEIELPFMVGAMYAALLQRKKEESQL